MQLIYNGFVYLAIFSTGRGKKKILHRFSYLWVCVAICSEAGQRVKEQRMCTSLLACMCACCFLNRPAAGVQSSKLSAKPACEGKDIYRPDTKESIDVGVVSAESPANPLYKVAATNLPPSLSQLSWREALKWQNDINNQYLKSRMDFLFWPWCPQCARPYCHTSCSRSTEKGYLTKIHWTQVFLLQV